MDSNSGKFIPASLKEMGDQVGKNDAELFKKIQDQISGGNPLPTLEPYEIVSIKGVDFKVMRMFPFTGKLELEMVKK